MRGLLAALGLIASLSGAFAQEFELPTLRGSAESLMPTPPTFTIWRGVYAGGQVGYSSASSDFGNGVNDLAASLVRNTVLEPFVTSMSTLPAGSSNGASVGAFLGYNTQWEGLVLGFEINYSHGSLTVGSAATAPTVLIANDAGAPPGHHFQYHLTVSGTETIRITDLSTFRARAGWIAGQFLPYGFLGLAVARADVNRSATVITRRDDFPDVTIPPTVPIPTSFGNGTNSDIQNGGFYFGYGAGIGMDVFVTPTVFVRGEWEYVTLPDIRGLNFTMNTVRTAIGAKF
jgi:outer membrane immunogenic protein